MIIALPNGKNAEFPANMSLDEIKSIVRQKFPPQSQNNVQDPNLLQQAGNAVEKNFNVPFEQQVVNPLNSAVQGFGQGLANVPSGLYNLAASGINSLGGGLPKAPMLDIAPHNLAADAGNVASFFAGAGILKGISKAPEIMGATQAAMKIPFIAKMISHAGNYIARNPVRSRVASNAILGGSYNPEHPVLGMLAGGASPVVGKAIGYGANTIKNAFQKIDPRGVAKSIQSHYDALYDTAADLFKKVGSEAVKRGVDKVAIDKDILDKIPQYLPDTRASEKLIYELKSNSYDALRKMQTELWHRGTKAVKSVLPSENKQGEEMLDLRDRINESIVNHFKNTGHQDLSNMLGKAKNIYKDLMETYFAKKTPAAIKNLVHKDSRKIPKNIMNVLSEESVPMEKIRNDNPFVSHNLELQRQRNNALNRLKFLGSAPGITTGLIGGALGSFAIPKLYHEAENALSS